MTRGKSQPPKQLMNAVAMESANRAYVQQTLNRLKNIATGESPELVVETASSEEIETEKAVAKKSTPRKKAADEKKTASKTTSATKASATAKKPAMKSRKVAKPTPSVEEDMKTVK